MKKYENPEIEFYILSENVLTESGDNLGNDNDFKPLTDELFLSVF